MEEDIDWKSIYKFPFVLNFETKVMTSDFKMAFDFIPRWMKSVVSVQISLEDKEKIVRILNGSDEKVKKVHTYVYENGTIHLNGLPLIWIRGWGHLIGVGGLNLSDDQAIKIQNGLADYIITTLTNATEIEITDNII